MDSQAAASLREWNNRYKVVRRLGSGSFGTVWAVNDLKADDPHAKT
jgi:hypothetical protein